MKEVLWSENRSCKAVLKLNGTAELIHILSSELAAIRNVLAAIITSFFKKNSKYYFKFIAIEELLFSLQKPFLAFNLQVYFFSKPSSSDIWNKNIAVLLHFFPWNPCIISLSEKDSARMKQGEFDLQEAEHLERQLKPSAPKTSGLLRSHSIWLPPKNKKGGR